MIQPICKQLHSKPAVSTKMRNLILALMLTLAMLVLPVRAAPQSSAGNGNKLFLQVVAADTDESAAGGKATPILFKASLRKLPNAVEREDPSPLCLGSACG
ncbi:MAG: hypothetical protein U0350_10985 [Caldilineaceae bacterium]